VNNIRQSDGWHCLNRRAAGAVLALAVTLFLAATASPSQAQTYRKLHAFHGPDGAVPYGGLLRDPGGNLYGTTEYGGDFGNGTVFRLGKSGKLTVLHSFAGSPTDGAFPRATLIRDSAGYLYGTTSEGGTSNLGTVFRVDTSGNESVLHSFAGGSGDGAYPYARVVRDSAGNLYGTTYSGGSANCTTEFGPGCGTVYRVDAAGVETVLHAFTGGAEGSNPYGGVLVAATGDLYGTADLGGNLTCPGHGESGCGTLFKLDPAGTYTVLHTFHGGMDGATPLGDLIRDAAGNLYGTTAVGGSQGAIGSGTIYRLGAGGKITVLHRFVGFDGYCPVGSLLRDSAGNLYGTTWAGGAQDWGVVFKLGKNGTFSVLHEFDGRGEGGGAQSGLVADAGNNLYGTTTDSAAHNNYGTVFEIIP